MNHTFAHVHNTEKGQVLVTKEYEPDVDNFLITIWFPVDEIGLGKVKIEVKDEESAGITFTKLASFQVLKANLNMILNQDFL